ncbi:MAG TPA: UDP-N-acetylmuramoyl-L-alanine--D-glutamate ligase [Gemmatimonadaceae bacterium]|jgi:UDP-N-acetylmuramoylalanine--D-glutamate ligase|nr:UDP-N-acetylmuramoyl-L-alanine--D-glutamate ligase [Gemmatimonadaceae bacterium]
MIPGEWSRGEIAVIGLGKSGIAASRLLVRRGYRVYASDSGSSPLMERGVAELRAAGAAVDVGRHDIERISRASLVVASPGVPPSSEALRAARDANVTVVSEIEIGLRFLGPATRYIAVTGTNGKTTTTALVGHLLRSLGHSAVDAGNIGTPLTEIALSDDPPRWLALEMSSFQLHDTPSIAPTVGVLTNLSPDHLDRYESVRDYYADKALLFRNATENSKWVVNDGDQAAVEMVSRAKGHHFHFGRSRLCEMVYERPGTPSEGWITWRGQRVIRRDEIPLLGDHNVENAMAAALAVIVADERHTDGAALARIAEGLRTFAALPHRLESVVERDGVLWINDSKATNPSSTLVALRAMTRPAIVLLGGRHKGEPYTSLAEPLKSIGKAVIAYGEAGPIVEQDLSETLPVHRLGFDFEEVMALARSLAAPGDVVLLSPACSSYDMFANYVERGKRFRELARGEES